MRKENKHRFKVVVDTNVYISGLNFKGKPRLILDMIWQEEIDVFISSFILEELEKILKESFKWDRHEIENVIKKIEEKTKRVETSVRLSVIKEKDEDNRILECAITANAQYVISGDKRHLLSLKEYQGIEIVSPADFLLVRENLR